MVTPIAITVTIEILRKIVIILLIFRNVSGITAEKNKNKNIIVITVPHLVKKSTKENLFLDLVKLSSIINDLL
jgi:hypothetical protein